MKPVSKPCKSARRPLVLTLVAVAVIAIPATISLPKFCLWNASASVPVGLYAVLPHARVRIGDLAVSRLPLDTRTLAADRHYLPDGVLLIKPVSATAGMTVCRRGAQISISGVVVAEAKSTDRLHRTMPVWSGCRRLTEGDIFLMNATVVDSFDGRYFGPTPIGLVQGRAIPLMTFATYER